VDDSESTNVIRSHALVAGLTTIKNELFVLPERLMPLIPRGVLVDVCLTESFELIRTIDVEWNVVGYLNSLTLCEKNSRLYVGTWRERIVALFIK